MEEGGVFDDERISGLVSNNKRGREDDNGKIGRLEKKPSGMVIIEEYSGDEMINGVKYEEEKDSLSPSPKPNTSGGGLFNQLINNLVSPRASDQPHEHVFESNGDKNGHVPSGENGNGGGGGGGGGGGVIKNLVSGMFSSNGGDEVVDDKDGGEVVEDGGDEVVDNDNIVAKLPRTLSEDAVPATAPAPATAPPADEASILLHSIIHD